MSKSKIIGATSVGIASSLFASLGFVTCCGFPIIAGLLSAVGIGASQLSFLAQYQEYFLLFAILSLGFGFYNLYFKQDSSSCGCSGSTEESDCGCSTTTEESDCGCSTSAPETDCGCSAPAEEAPCGCPTSDDSDCGCSTSDTSSCCVTPQSNGFSFKKHLPHFLLWGAAILVFKMLFFDMENNMNEGEGEGVNTLVGTMQYFVFIVTELVVLFVSITALIEVIMMHIPQDKLRKWLSGRGILGNFLATVFGSLTPFCACSTIPMTVGFLRAGVTFGSVMSFLISSPLLNPIVIGMLVALMGAKVAIMYFALAFIAAMLFGYFLEKINAEKYVKFEYKNSNNNIDGVLHEDERLKLSFGQKCAEGIKAGWKSLKPVMLYLLIGVSLGAVIYGYMPEDLVLQIAGPDNPFAIPVAAILGVPLYIRAETAIPIGIALMGKGMSVGAVIALIIGGAGMAIPEMSMMASIFKKKLVAMIVLVIFSTAVIGGYLFNLAV